MRGQLTLFSAEAEAERTLLEALDHLRAAYAALEDRYLALWQEHKTIQATLEAKRQELATVRKAAREALDAAWLQVEFWQDLAQTARPTAAHAALAPILTQLLTVTHPDHWSQGQPAAQLAHEICVTLNNLRSRREGGRI